MDSTSNNHFIICHSIPGRLRIKSTFIRYAVDIAYALEQALAEPIEIEKVEARPLTGSVIILYDCKKLTFHNLLKLLSKFIEDLPKKQIIRQECKVCPQSKPTSSFKSLKKQLFQVIALTGFLIYSLIRSVIFRSPLSQGPLSFVAFTATIGAFPLLRQAWKDLREGRSLSFFPFLATTFVIAILIGEAMAAFEIIWVLAIAMLLEDYVADRSIRAIRAVLQVHVKNTYILVNNKELEVPVENVRKGDVLAVHANEKIPVDGIVIRGEALVDCASITGRSEPDFLQKDDRVFAGTILQQGILYILAEKVGEETYLCRVLAMVEESLAKRAPAEKRADILAAELMRFSSLAVLGTFLLTRDLIRTFTVMVVMSCPCATILAASTAVAAAIANAARNHIIVKGGLYLEQFGETDCFCFDKTGTVTIELPHVVDIIPRTSRHRPDRILELAASAEIHNPHPVAKALVKAALERGMKLETDSDRKIILGRGVRVKKGHDHILVGNDSFMEEEGITIAYFNKKAKYLIDSGCTVLYVAKNSAAQGIIGITNTVRTGTKDVLNQLREDGVSFISLITGDSQSIAKNVSEFLGFDDFRAALLPKEKAHYVHQLEQNGRRAVVVGDGINDTLALSKASVGVAMAAGGAEAAIETADIALADSKLQRLVFLRKLSHKTIQTINQNYWLAITTDIFGLFLEALGRLSPVLGGILHITHTLGIMLNSGRLLEWEPPSHSSD